MSFVGNMFGGDGAGKGPSGANIIRSVSSKNAEDALYKVQDANAAQTNLMNNINNQNGIGKQVDVYNQQQNLASILQNQAMGIGPNPAMAQLAQATQANTANQAALMAGQRGAGANAGLIARQAAMQGANNQQQMTGQAATMQAQQQIAAQQQLGQQQQNLAGLSTAMTNQHQQATAQNVAAAQGLQSNIWGAIANQNNAETGNQSNVNNVNAGLLQTNTNAQAGLLQGAGAALGMAHGGVVQKFASGGEVGPSSILGQTLRSGVPVLAGPDINNGAQLMNSNVQSMAPNEKVKQKEEPNGTGNIAGGPMDTGSQSFGTMLASRGTFVQGGSAPIPGDSPKNDTVPAMLSPGEVVIPRSIINSKNAPDKARAFVEAILAKQGMRR